jgi:dynein heavy chain 2
MLAMGEAAQLKVELTQAQNVIAQAEGLIGKLDGERVRWSAQLALLEGDLAALPAKAMLAAAFITLGKLLVEFFVINYFFLYRYLAKASETERQETMAQWQAVLQVPAFDLRQFLTTESETLKWKAEGLAADSLSIENALVILNSQQAPCVFCCLVSACLLKLFAVVRQVLGRSGLQGNRLAEGPSAGSEA